MAVGSPEAPILLPDGDDRIEKSAEPVDDVGQPLGVRLREVALERRRLHAVERQRGEDLPEAAERIAEDSQHRPAVPLDLLPQLRRGSGRGAGGEIGHASPGGSFLCSFSEASRLRTARLYVRAMEPEAAGARPIFKDVLEARLRIRPAPSADAAAPVPRSTPRPARIAAGSNTRTTTRQFLRAQRSSR